MILGDVKAFLAEPAGAAEALRIEQADLELGAGVLVRVLELDIEPRDALRHDERMFLVGALVGRRQLAAEHDRLITG